MTDHFGTIFRELMRALAVLAFAFLSFAHQPPAIERYGNSPAVTYAFICGSGLTGDPAGDSGKSGFRCDACRIATSADLPAPPDFACPVPQPLGLASAPPPSSGLSPAPVITAGGPRAPPLRSFA